MEPDEFVCSYDGDCLNGRICKTNDGSYPGLDDGICRDANWCKIEKHCEKRQTCNIIKNVCENLTGTSCNSQNDCTNGFYCKDDICIKNKVEGSSCEVQSNYSECEENLKCQNNICIKWGGTDGPCEYDFECLTGYKCKNSLCSKWGYINGPCEYDSDCIDGYDCSNNFCACIVPTNEMCNGIDDDCDNIVDNFNPNLVCDTKNHTLWQKHGSSIKLNWIDTMEYCRELDYQNITNWKVPDIDDFRNLLSNCGEEEIDDCDSCAASPLCNSIFPGDTKTYWADTYYSHYLVNLANGDIREPSDNNEEYNVRCVY